MDLQKQIIKVLKEAKDEKISPREVRNLPEFFRNRILMMILAGDYEKFHQICIKRELEFYQMVFELATENAAAQKSLCAFNEENRKNFLHKMKARWQLSHGSFEELEKYAIFLADWLIKVYRESIADHWLLVSQASAPAGDEPYASRLVPFLFNFATLDRDLVYRLRRAFAYPQSEDYNKINFYL